MQKKRTGLRKRLIFTILALLMLTTILYFYVNNIFLPVKLKGYIVQKVQSKINRSTSIGRLSFTPLKGIIVRDFEIFESDEHSKSFFKAKEISFHILLAPYLKNKKIIIPSIRVEKPYLAVHKLADHEWNFTDLLNLNKEPAASASVGEVQLPQVAIGKIEINDATLDYKDQTLETPFLESFEGVDLLLKITPQLTVDIQARTKVLRIGSLIAAEGNYNLKTRSLNLNLNLTDLSIDRYIPLLPAENVTLQQGNVSTAALNILADKDTMSLTGSGTLFVKDFQWGPNKMVTSQLAFSDLNIQSNKGIISASASIKASNLQAVYGEFSIEGDTFSSALSFAPAKEKSFAISGQLSGNSVRLLKQKALSLSSDVHIENLKLVSSENTYEISGNIELPNAVLQQDTTHLKGPFLFSSTNMSFGPDMLSLQANVTAGPIELELANDRKLTGKIAARKFGLSYAGAELDIDLDGQLEDLFLKLNKTQSFAGSPGLKLKYSLDTETKTFNYNGVLNLAGATIENAPKIGTVTEIKGELTFDKEFVSTKKLSFFAYEAPFDLKGVVNDFKNPEVDIHVTAKALNLARINELFGAKINSYVADASGLLDLNLSINGLLNALDKAEISGQIDLKDASLSLTVLKDPIHKLYGQINFSDNKIKWKDLKGSIKGQSLVLNGQLVNFSRPIIETTLQTKDFYSDTSVNILRQAIQITNAKGKLFDSSFDIKGDVHFREAKGADMDLRFKLGLNLEDLSHLPPEWYKKVERFKARGKIHLEGLFQGYYNDWRNWSLSLNGESSLLELFGHPLRSNVFQYKQRDQYISQASLASILYDGEYTMLSTADLHEDTDHFDAKININALNLLKLANEKKLKKKLEGTLFADTYLTGKIKDPLNSLKGDGNFTIKNGHIWHHRVLEGLVSTLLIPEFQNLVFTDARAKFYIKNNKILTEDAQLFSQAVNLNGRGWIDFNKNINISVQPKFSEIALIQSESLKKAPTSLIQNAISVKVTGTLDKPQYKADSSPLKILEKTTGALKGGLQEIFEGIFE